MFEEVSEGVHVFLPSNFPCIIVVSFCAFVKLTEFGLVSSVVKINTMETGYNFVLDPADNQNWTPYLLDVLYRWVKEALDEELELGD